jgi:hypothetical protein
MRLWWGSALRNARRLDNGASLSNESQIGLFHVIFFYNDLACWCGANYGSGMETLVMLTRIKLIALTAFLSSIAVASHAATLDSHFASALAGSTGSGAYSSGAGLDGIVHYAVFTETAYNSIFTGSTISVDPGELAYVYQVINTGTDFVSKNRIVGLNASVNGIGHADINLGGTGEVVPSNEIAPPPVADWEFLASNILSGENSSALVLTSTNIPDGTTTDVVFNGGGIGLVQVIVPGDIAIPEPASALLLVFGSTMLCLRRRRS